MHCNTSGDFEYSDFNQRSLIEMPSRYSIQTAGTVKFQLGFFMLAIFKVGILSCNGVFISLTFFSNFYTFK